MKPVSYFFKSGYFVSPLFLGYWLWLSLPFPCFVAVIFSSLCLYFVHPFLVVAVWRFLFLCFEDRGVISVELTLFSLWLLFLMWGRDGIDQRMPYEWLRPAGLHVSSPCLASCLSFLHPCGPSGCCLVQKPPNGCTAEPPLLQKTPEDQVPLYQLLALSLGP